MQVQLRHCPAWMNQSERARRLARNSISNAARHGALFVEVRGWFCLICADMLYRTWVNTCDASICTKSMMSTWRYHLLINFCFIHRIKCFKSWKLQLCYLELNVWTSFSMQITTGVFLSNRLSHLLRLLYQIRSLSIFRWVWSSALHKQTKKMENIERQFLLLPKGIWWFVGICSRPNSNKKKG